MAKLNLLREQFMGKKIKITVMKTARYDDLIEKYENPIEHACDMREGDTFIADGLVRRRRHLRRMDEEQKVCNDFVQRRLPPRHILFGGNRRRVKVYGIKKCGGKTAALF